MGWLALVGFTASFVCPHQSILPFPSCPSTRIFNIYPCYDPGQCFLPFYGYRMSTVWMSTFIHLLWVMLLEQASLHTFVPSSRSFRVGLQAVNPIFPHLSMTIAPFRIKRLFPWRQFSRTDSSLLFNAWEVQHHFLWEASCHGLGRGHFSCCIQHNCPEFGYAVYHTVFC